MLSPARVRTVNIFNRRQLLAMGIAVASGVEWLGAQTSSSSDVKGLLQRQTQSGNGSRSPCSPQLFGTSFSSKES